MDLQKNIDEGSAMVEKLLGNWDSLYGRDHERDTR